MGPEEGHLGADIFYQPIRTHREENVGINIPTSLLSYWIYHWYPNTLPPPTGQSEIEKTRSVLTSTQIRFPRLEKGEADLEWADDLLPAPVPGIPHVDAIWGGGYIWQGSGRGIQRKSGSSSLLLKCNQTNYFNFSLLSLEMSLVPTLKPFKRIFIV